MERNLEENIYWTELKRVHYQNSNSLHLQHPLGNMQNDHLKILSNPNNQLTVPLSSG